MIAQLHVVMVHIPVAGEMAKDSLIAVCFACAMDLFNK